MKLCNKCEEKYANYFAGSAMTRYDCCDCGEREEWGNTATPIRCGKCAKENNKCMRCDNQLV